MDSRKVDEKIDDTLNALADRSQRLDYVSMLGHCSKYAHHQSYHLGSASISVKDDLEVQMLARSFIDIHCALLGKRYQGALIEPSGSSSNLRALELARDRSGRKKVICTNLTHSSIFQACEYLDLEPIILEAKPDLGYQIDEEELARIVVRERDKVACVVSTHGTTQLGNIEDLTLSQSVQDLRSNGALLHIDAAYGGELSLFSSYLGAFPDADLMTIDPYKFIGKPGCSLLLGKAGLFAKSGPAVPYYESSDYTRSTTLSIEPILSWFYTLQENGAESIRGLADRTIGSARYVADMLRANRIRLISEPRLGVVAVSLQDNAEVCRIHEGLLQKGISVGKVAIRGKERLTAGLRLVITPRIPERHKYNLERLAGTLVCEIERHATYGDSTVDSILRPAREQDSTQIHRIQEYYLDKFQKKTPLRAFS